MLGPKKNSCEEFDNEKKIPAARDPPPPSPPPITVFFLCQVILLHAKNEARERQSLEPT